LTCIGITALALGFVLGLQTMPPEAFEASQPKNSKPPQHSDSGVSVRTQVPKNGRLRLASLEVGGFLEPATEDSQVVELRSSAVFPAENAAPNPYMPSFDEHFANLVGLPGSPPVAQQRPDRIGQPSPGRDGQASSRRVMSQSAPAAVPLPPVSPSSPSKKQVRMAEAPAASIAPADLDERTAIYDISAHRVYLPDGQWLEAHSGFGSRLDDPRYVSEKDLGPTPPNVYDLSLREESFHGVRAIRLNPVGGGSMYGREGLLAHSYMLGPNGQSNGCVSINDYPAFLSAYLSGGINRLVVVDHLANPPGPRTALGWLTQPIRALFGRS
jgi:hypothetical protein